MISVDTRPASLPVARPCQLAAQVALTSASVVSALLGAACQYEPSRPLVHYDLADATRALGQDGLPVVPPDVQDHIRGSLGMLFGSPQNPRYMRLSEWIDAGYDPSWPSFAAGDDGSGEFSEEELAEIEADNARHFRRQLASIEAGRFEELEGPDSAPELSRAWRELLAETPPGERGEEFQSAAAELFRSWYPSLSDSAELYRQQCLHCHGPEGGGNGPTARFLDPKPRDYRLGIFKFTPLKDKAVPRRRDLYRILDEGVYGTAMPSFRRFSRAQLEGLVDYVRLLSMRGMVEKDLRSTFEIDGSIPVEYVVESYRGVVEKWRLSEEDRALVVAYEAPVPPATSESLARGRELFNDAKTGNCFSCHGATGRGDGLSAFTVDPETGEKRSAYNDDWGVPILPRNLTVGLFRGGRRPIDVFRRIKAGINGTPMPALAGTLSDEDIWAVVHYVGTLYESGLFYPAAAHAHAAQGEGH